MKKDTILLISSHLLHLLFPLTIIILNIFLNEFDFDFSIFVILLYVENAIVSGIFNVNFYVCGAYQIFIFTYFLFIIISVAVKNWILFLGLTITPLFIHLINKEEKRIAELENEVLNLKTSLLSERCRENV